MKNKNLRFYYDPVHGVISFPFPIVQKVIDHPYMQRLRRITQCGLIHYVFPGASHTRFHHTMGVAHLAYKVLNVLKIKEIHISDEEVEATCLAALLHDIGHGPLSHALEHKIVPHHHETMSILIAKEMNKQFGGALDMAIDILSFKYSKPFLSQLITSQLDVDRMDYLARDSFYTGVEEGRIGIDRLTRTFNVYNNRLVSEEKALQTIEKFLVARHHMYWQVYIHKAVLSIQQMLIMLIERIKWVIQCKMNTELPQALSHLLKNAGHESPSNILEAFITLDDISIMHVIKSNLHHDDSVLSFLCKCLLNRKIFHLEWINIEKKEYLIAQKLQKIKNTPCDLNDETRFLVRAGSEKSDSYRLDKEIEIFTNCGNVMPLSEISHVFFKEESLIKSFICYPRP
ncbi:MAG: HD domain-containing protein [Saprospiraceae bacterium]